MIGSAGIASLSGCNEQSGTSEPVEFSNSTERESDTAGGSDAPVFSGGGTRDFLEAIKYLQRRGGGELVIAEGVYRFERVEPPSPEGSNVHARIEDIHDVTIEGNGATIAFTKPTWGGL